jgi:hypothetical protein
MNEVSPTWFGIESDRNEAHKHVVFHHSAESTNAHLIVKGLRKVRCRVCCRHFPCSYSEQVISSPGVPMASKITDVHCMCTLAASKNLTSSVYQLSRLPSIFTSSLAVSKATLITASHRAHSYLTNETMKRAREKTTECRVVFSPSAARVGGRDAHVPLTSKEPYANFEVEHGHRARTYTLARPEGLGIPTQGCFDVAGQAISTLVQITCLAACLQCHRLYSTYRYPFDSGIQHL